MTDFRLDRPVDAAYCLVNTFRHLLTEEAARRHLECVAENLRPGGIYLLGLHLLPLDAAEEHGERWTARQGQTQVTVTLRVLSADRRRRIEDLRVSFSSAAAGTGRQGDRAVPFSAGLRHEFPFRMYTADQFRRLLLSLAGLCDIYDFWFEIDRPLTWTTRWPIRFSFCGSGWPTPRR